MKVKLVSGEDGFVERKLCGVYEMRREEEKGGLGARLVDWLVH
jgi:hypothetical protein